MSAWVSSNSRVMGWSRGLRCNQPPLLVTALDLKVDLVLELDFKVFGGRGPREIPLVVGGRGGRDGLAVQLHGRGNLLGRGE